MATVEEDEIKMIAAINVGGKNDGAYNSDANSDGNDSNGNGTYDAGVDTVITNGGATSSLAADASLKVFGNGFDSCHECIRFG